MASRQPFSAVLLAPLVLFALGAAPPPADEDTRGDEEILKSAGVSVEGPALLEFFRKRTQGDDLRRRIAVRVRELGDDDFAIRQRATEDLIAVGAPALPALKKAVGSGDLEVVRRATRCLNEIAALRVDLPVSAARLLVVRRPPRAVEVLLAYLPDAEDEAVEEEVLSALARLGGAGGKPHPALVAAAHDREPLRRLAAAHVLGRSDVAGHRAEAQRLLRDADLRVRLGAAQVLLSVGFRDAIPPLIPLLEEAPVDLAYQAEDLLVHLAGDAAPAPLEVSSPEARHKSRLAWQTWWTTRGAGADLTAVRAGSPPSLTITCQCGVGGAENAGRVEARGPGGKVRWQIADMGNPTCVQLLPAGRVLIAQYRDRKVVERNREGKVVWEYNPDGLPICAERVTGGNTLIGTLDNKVLLVTPEGKVVLEHRAAGMVFAVHKQPNGRILYLTTGEIVELTTEGVVTRRIRAGNIASWGGLEVLPGDRFLVAQYGVGKVVEMDAAGKVLWEWTAGHPASATRLRNGHILVAEAEKRRLVELDRDGKEVAGQDLPGRPFFVRRY
jgi:hypothetical protein